MPVKTAKKKLKVKKATKPVVQESPISDVELKEPLETVDTTPKIASFSQLDSKVPPVSNSEILIPQEVDQPKHSSIGPVDIPPQTESDFSSIEEKEVENETSETSSEDIKSWLKDIRPDTTKEIEKKNGFSFKLFFVFIILFAMIGALIGGMFYYANSVGTKPESKTEITPTLSTTVSPTVTPSPTPDPKADLSKLKVSVLNGSGVSGEAGKVKTLLTEKGFLAGNVTAGNANASNHKDTVVSLKANVPEQVYKEIESALSAYTVTKGEKPLAETSTRDVEIIVGTKK